MAENPKVLEGAAVACIQRMLAAYGSQRDPINDSDLDNEQPITLSVHLDLGTIRWARRFVIHTGHNPADFRVRASD